jgi:hypothetical protein
MKKREELSKMNAALKYLTALLGFWLIVEVSVFPTDAARWISFATAIALVVVALGDATLSVVRRRLVAASTATLTMLLAGFLIIASLVFVHASVTWLMAISGGAIEALALLGLFAPARIRLVAFTPAMSNGRAEHRVHRARVAS